jgi:sulfur-oxidizing protein SoxZ
MARALITMPPTAKRGDVVEIRTLIAHPMETGYRAGDDGQILPRNILRRFSCRYDGELVFSADLFPAVAANPYLTFCTVATASGTLEFTWEGDRGFAQTERVALTVTG